MMKNTNRPAHKSGFTLIELLVVIAIIGILAALLFPAFQSARRKVNSSKCQSNMSQVHKAFVMYITDHNNRFPGDSLASWTDATKMNYGGGDGDSGKPRIPDSDRPLYEYVKDPGVFECPSDRGSTNSGVGSGSETVFEKFGTSYVYALEDDSVAKVIGVGGKKLTDRRFNATAKKVVLYEPPLIGDFVKGGDDLVNKDQWHELTRRGCNASYLDGHVEKVLMHDEKMPTGDNPAEGASDDEKITYY